MVQSPNVLASAAGGLLKAVRAKPRMSGPESFAAGDEQGGDQQVNDQNKPSNLETGRGGIGGGIGGGSGDATVCRPDKPDGDPGPISLVWRSFKDADKKAFAWLFGALTTVVGTAVGATWKLSTTANKIVFRSELETQLGELSTKLETKLDTKLDKLETKLDTKLDKLALQLQNRLLLLVITGVLFVRKPDVPNVRTIGSAAEQ